MLAGRDSKEKGANEGKIGGANGSYQEKKVISRFIVSICSLNLPCVIYSTKIMIIKGIFKS